jgi:hypothetical protein
MTEEGPMLRALMLVAAAAALATNSECPGEPAPIKTSCGIGISCDTTSVALVQSIAITNLPATLQAGTSITMTATAYDSTGNVLTGVLFTYSTSDPTIATIDASGLVYGVAPGTVSLSASAGTKTAARSIIIYQ